MSRKTILAIVIIIAILLGGVEAVAATTTESTTGGIAAFARDWWWSQNYNQDGEYGECSVNISIPGGVTIESATLSFTHSYSQQSGSADGEAYIETSQQVTPKDAEHDHGTRWYGDVASTGTKAGSFTTTYSGGSSSFDITSFIASNPASTYYVAIRNLDSADIGINSIKITVTYSDQPAPTPTPTVEPTIEPTVAPTVEPTVTETAMPAPTEAKFRVGPTVVLRPVNDVIDKSQDGLVELYMNNPSLNDVTLTADVQISVPSGIYVYGEGFGYGGAAGTVAGKFEVPPGTVRTIHINIKGEKVGDFTIHFTGLYWPDDVKDYFQQISLTHPFTVNEPSPDPRDPEPTGRTGRDGMEGLPLPSGLLTVIAIAFIVLIFRKPPST